MTADDDLMLKARALPRAVAPPRDLWPDIAARLDDDPSESDPDASAAQVPMRRWQPLALAAGLLLALILGFWLGRAPEAPTPMASTTTADEATPRTVALMPDTHLRQARIDLAADIERRIAELDPETRAVVLDNLAAINQALDGIDAALAASPDSELDTRLLMAMYADQLVLLNSMNNALYPSTTEITL